MALPNLGAPYTQIISTYDPTSRGLRLILSISWSTLCNFHLWPDFKGIKTQGGFSQRFLFHDSNFHLWPDFKGIKTHKHVGFASRYILLYFHLWPDFKGIKTFFSTLSATLLPPKISTYDPTSRGLRHPFDLIIILLFEDFHLWPDFNMSDR